MAGSRAGKLSKDSSNIVELVKQQYEKITTSINVKSNHSTNCDVKIKAKCRSVDMYIYVCFVKSKLIFFLLTLKMGVIFTPFTWSKWNMDVKINFCPKNDGERGLVFFFSF